MATEPSSSDAYVSPERLRRFSSALRELGRARDIDQTLQLIVDLAVELISGVDVADVMFVRSGQVTVPVATDPVARALDEVQQQSGGPCMSALDDEPIVVVHDLQEDQRWPEFADAAKEHGIRSVAAYRLFVHHNGDDRLGALNLFGREPGIDEASIELGGLFASQCSAVLKAAISEEGLQSALRSRDVIGQAKGILMERHRLTADQAYDMLRRASNDRNVKVRELADEVTRTGQLP